MVDNLQKFESFKHNNTILFEPSGEIIDLSDNEIDKIGEFIILDYNDKYDSYMINDDFKDVVMMILNDEK